jgi:predicted ATPase/signal transduction histidine kinase/tRNA A-37 threonylcarbamoyl transferase component Bud32
MVDIPGYRLVGAVRKTGYNLLLQARREADDQPVILKTPLEPCVGPREREQYRREFAILRRLEDVRGVPRPYACEWSQGRPVLVLEQVRGEPLSETVGKPYEVSRFLALAISLASTLSDIHRHGIIHKDLKPSNIIAEPSGTARIIDFGLASLQRREHLEAVSLHLLEGTLAYMSPEQTGRMNRTLDYRTDFYSLGVTFYELLTGVRPFQAHDTLEWFHAHMAQSPRPPRELVPGLPPTLSELVMKLLAKVAEERYQSADGLKADLERCQEDLRRGAVEPFTLGQKDHPSQFQPPQALYGREAHVHTLLEGFERVARSGRPELLLVRGYSGMGKSSLVNELHKPVVRRHGFLLSGKFDPLQRDVPYATLAQAIGGLVRQLLAGSEEELARWRERLMEVWEGHGQLLVDLVPLLERVVGRQPAVPPLTPAEVRHHFHRVLLRFLGVFASREHPLVVFLDDLQWADAASLRLLQHLLTHPEPPPVLWLGAYRDNEVGPSHPLTLVLEELRKADSPLTELQLEPLSLEQIQRLLADSLPGAGQDVLVPLSRLLQEKTGGNPFFLIQLMVKLYQDDLLGRTSEGTWRWDAEGIQARAYSDNIVDFLVGRLRQLPARTQHLLRLAACEGNVFSPRTLSALSDSLELAEVEQGLEPALEEGLLMRSRDTGQYRFLHDRIQQAAESLSSEQERKQTHLRIGQLLLEQLPPEQVRERIFDVVSQLNAGAELLHEPARRHHLARLNAEAARRAMASIAYRPALTFLTTAFTLLPDDPWEADPTLAFQLKLDEAACELQSTHIDRALLLVEELRPRMRTREDIVSLYVLKSDILNVKGDMPGATASSLECLALLGRPLPAHPSPEEVKAAHEQVWALLGERPIASLIDLPPMTEPDIQGEMRILAALSSAFFTSKQLYLVVVCRMVSLTLLHGFTSAAVPGYCWLGVLSGAFFGRYREGLALSQLAREFVERYELSTHRAAVLFASQFITFWTQPVPLTQELAVASLHHASQQGNLSVAGFAACSIIQNRLAMGHDLEDVHQEALSYADFIRGNNTPAPGALLMLRLRLIQQLRGLSHSFDTLSGEGFDEERFEASMEQPTHLMRCHYWLIKMRARFMSGAWPEALEAADKVAEQLMTINTTAEHLNFHLYRALSLAGCLDPASPRPRALEELARHQQQLATWAELCPETFRAPERMVAAELARVTNRPQEAIRAYEEAIHAAREGHFTQYEGMTQELAANFWRAAGAPAIALALVKEARAAYVRWGAQGKVRHLDARWPGLTPDRSEADTLTYSANSTRIDALSVVKAQQAISGEIVLERLVTTLLRVAIENAGAQRGALLLPDGDRLAVAASSDPSSEEPPRLLPWSLIAYVRRTHEPVLLDDAARPHPFSADAYLAASQVRSVLCLPLMRQERFSGALYLENNLVTNAFSPERLSLLSHLVSQAAISIENARLYADVQRAEAALRDANDELERRVEERTRELKEAQARLVSTAREVGMAEVASNVLHNVGNVLTSAVVNLEMMRGGVTSLRLSQLKRAVGLMLQHRDTLADFLTRDARGRQLPDYLSALSNDLLRGQTVLLEEMDAMGKHVEHIRAIVQVQQTYAKASLLTEECELSQLITDALRIQLPALQRHGIRITQQLEAVPKVKVDKHKVLQILINLISNAKYALDVIPEGQRHLCVRLRAEENRALIQLVDNGMGIAPELRERLFSHGFTTRKGGHGFGLHSSALTAGLLGGRLTLESAGLGQGATATLELPLGEASLDALA